ncbi:MAG: hypothetical protein DRI95_02075 [Bacteroidetes bacterium]|nr:MAG: hypothetical protein DRI95_02075 [Bacteroidota bacterium]
MRYLIISFLFIGLLSCNNLNSGNEFETSLYKKHFTKSERNELSNIVSYVDSLILSKNKYTEIDKAYHYYLDSVYQLAANGDESGLSFNEEQKYSFLFNIDTILFKKIWVKSTTSRIVRTRDTTLYYPNNFISIDLNNNGEYVDIIEELGKNSTYYKALHESIKAAGGLSPTAVSGFLYYNNDFDFNNLNNKIWASIFLLTTEESVEMKVKRYLKK